MFAMFDNEWLILSGFDCCSNVSGAWLNASGSVLVK